ncbi:MAG: hypothetical protein ABI042_19910 [Verrucomicrobiota bacterium]
MSIEQVEFAILELPPEERRRLLSWLDENRRELFGAMGEALGEPQKKELLRRRQEYFEQPERFIHLNNEEELDRFFAGIRHEVQTRLSSTRQN